MSTFVMRGGIANNALIPVDAQSEENISKCKQGAVYQIVPRRSNNPDFHRKVMRLVRDLYENQEAIESEKAFEAALKVKCGWVEESTFEVPVDARKHAAAKWCREVSEKGGGISVALLALSDVLLEPNVQYITKSWAFDKCSQDEREEFWEALKHYAGPVLGWDHVAGYER